MTDARKNDFGNGKPRTWTPGVADEVWMVMVSARDANKAEDMIKTLAYILAEGHARSLAEAADVIRQFSGDQIAGAIVNYHEGAIKSVLNGMNSRRDTGK